MSRDLEVQPVEAGPSTQGIGRSCGCGQPLPKIHALLPVDRVPGVPRLVAVVYVCPHCDAAWPYNVPIQWRDGFAPALEVARKKTEDETEDALKPRGLPLRGGQ